MFLLWPLMACGILSAVMKQLPLFRAHFPLLKYQIQKGKPSGFDYFEPMSVVMRCKVFSCSIFIEENYNQSNPVNWIAVRIDLGIFMIDAMSGGWFIIKKMLKFDKYNIATTNNNVLYVFRYTLAAQDLLMHARGMHRGQWKTTDDITVFLIPLCCYGNNSSKV